MSAEPARGAPRYTPRMDLYQRSFVDRGTERLALFALLRDTFAIESALYLGSFVHLTPALVFPVTVLVDNDKRMRTVVADAPAIERYVTAHRHYPAPPRLTLLHQDYQTELPLPLASFDLVISQFAGFVSLAGKPYLKPGGLLLVNDSHGDASIAQMDGDFQLIATLENAQGHWVLSANKLDDYFIPKSGRPIDRVAILATMKPPPYTRTADNYLFRKTA